MAELVHILRKNAMEDTQELAGTQILLHPASMARSAI